MKITNPTSEKEAVRMIRENGDEKAFEYIMKRYEKSVITSVQARIAGLTYQHDWQDIVQEIFKGLWCELRKRAPERDEEPIDRLVARITRNVRIDHTRKARVRRFKFHVPLDSVVEPEAPGDRPDNTREQILEYAESLLVILPPKHRQVFVDQELLGHSREEIAHKNNITLSSVVAYLEAARQRLRKEYVACRSKPHQSPDDVAPKQSPITNTIKEQLALPLDDSQRIAVGSS